MKRLLGTNGKTLRELDSRTKEGGVTVILRKEKQALQRVYLEAMKIHLHEDTFTQKSRKISFKKWLKNLWQSEQHNYENRSSWPKRKKQGGEKSKMEQFHWENVWKIKVKIILKKLHRCEFILFLKNCVNRIRCFRLFSRLNFLYIFTSFTLSSLKMLQLGNNCMEYPTFPRDIVVKRKRYFFQSYASED